ncbi:MAG: hypothetical protein HYZ00_13775 [Candidatus Hydrogenedentes bacterium]|nr:hypothetical protein [Candidatus Hydrogenedentota bacterium]
MTGEALEFRAGGGGALDAWAEPDLGNPWVRQHLHDFRAPAKTQRLWRTFMIIGAATLALGLFVAPGRVWAAVLLAGMYLIGLGLGGLFLVAMHYLTAAGWRVVIRRVPEAMVSLLPAGLLAVGAVLVLHPSLYEWIHAETGELIGFKGFWLSYGFLLFRALLFAAVWLGFAAVMLGHSRLQDFDGDVDHTRRNVAVSAAFAVCFALSYWLANVDWVMSLEPHWFSTIFGVYNFTGLFAGSLACTILVAHWLRQQPLLRAIIRDDHMHDLGKLLLGACTLWAYIWFSQYMLIWYANIPEETVYYVQRQAGAWHPLFLMNPILNWVIPFFVLLPRGCKRSGSVLTRVAFVVLVGHWLDLYLMIFPSVSPDAPSFGLWEAGIALGAAGVIGALVLRALGRAALVPLKDPYLQESLNHHQ